MKKFRILVDLDSTITDTLPAWLTVITAKTGVKVTVDDITEWNMCKCGPLTQLTPDQIFDVLHDPAFLQTILPIEGALENLKKLHDFGHEIKVVTARQHPNTVVAAMDWVKTFMPWFDPQKNLIFAYDKHIIKADVMIDDKGQTLEEYKVNWPKALCLGIQYPYNSYLKYNLFVNLIPRDNQSWNEIYSLIQQYSEYTHNEDLKRMKF